MDRMVVAYSFDLRTNELATTLVPNPNAGSEHVVKAYRGAGDPIEAITLCERSREIAERNYAEVDDDNE